MSNEAKTLIERARALPPEDRIALVGAVLDSLDCADHRYRSTVDLELRPGDVADRLLHSRCCEKAPYSGARSRIACSAFAPCASGGGA